MWLLCALVCPPWTVAPPKHRDPNCACTLSHSELAGLCVLQKHAPDTGKLALPVDDITIDVGMQTPEAALVDRYGIELVIGRDRGTTRAPWQFLNKMVKKRRVGVWECWRVDSDGDRTADGDDDELPCRVEGFSDLTQRSASLLPLEGKVPPTAVLGGFNMHRMKDVSPNQDTERKLGALGSKLRGSVLDICTGLGYTAIGAAEKPSVEAVFTIELDPLMVSRRRLDGRGRAHTHPLARAHG